MIGTAPSFPASQMNGIGPGGQPVYHSLANPLSPTNGMSGPPGPLAQPLFPSMVNRPPLGHHERHLNGVSQDHSPTIVPSSQPQGGSQQPLESLIEPGPSPQISRAHFPPPSGPQHPQDPGSVGFAHPTPSPAHQQLVRPHGSHDISSQNDHSRLPLSGPLPPSHERPYMDEAHTSFPEDDLGESKMRGGFGGREAQSLTVEEVGHYPSPEADFLTSGRLSCSILCASSKADHLITALVFLKPTCTRHCKIVGLLYNQCNSSYPYSNKAAQREIVLLVKRYVVFQQLSRGVGQLD